MRSVPLDAAQGGEEIAEQEGIDYRPELEEQADELIPWESGWIQHGSNQLAMLNGFFAAVQPPALMFFYAKRVPLTEKEGAGADRGGAGHACRLSRRNTEARTRSARSTWECMVQHSLRPDVGEGFLLPYHEALAAAEQDETIDPEQFVAFAPDEAWGEFSFTSEWVSQDTAITSLVALEQALRVAEAHLPRRRTKELQWVSDQLGALWTLRGPCPGLGAALHAFGVDQATLVVRRLEPLIPENGDPWQIVEQAMADPHAVVPGLQQHLGINLRKKWKVLDDQRRAC